MCVCIYIYIYMCVCIQLLRKSRHRAFLTPGWVGGKDVGCWMLSDRCWLLVAGFWLLLASCWLLAGGCHWLRAAADRWLSLLLAAGLCWQAAAGKHSIENDDFASTKCFSTAIRIDKTRCFRKRA